MEEEAGEIEKTHVDAVLRLQSSEAGLPACQLPSEATWMPGQA